MLNVISLPHFTSETVQNDNPTEPNVYFFVQSLGSQTCEKLQNWSIFCTLFIM